ncbi:MAG: hypothetical protein FWF29_07045 [Treponema sp.]|nr:hypothetical protein [Treponema sp.]
MKGTKITVFTVVLAVLAAQSAIAQSGLSATVDIDTNMVQFFHQKVRNDTFIEDAAMPRTDSVYFMRNPNYDDMTMSFVYNDPQDRFGGQVGFDFPAGVLDQFFRIGDTFGWARVTPYFMGKIGKYTDRVVSKIGGDQDLGVMLFHITDDGDLSFTTSDSLALASNVIGFTPTVISPEFSFGQLSLSGFFAPNEYYLGKKINSGLDAGGTPTGLPTIVPAYATYKFGGSLKYVLPGYLTFAAVYTTHHSMAGEGIDLGSIYHDFGLYAIINFASMPAIDGFNIGLGYSGHMDYLDQANKSDQIHAPLKSAVHVDLRYDNVLPSLSLGLYNNFSFYDLDKKDTIAYTKDAADHFADEKGFVSYNEFDIAYQVTDTLVTTFMVRNYYGIMNNYTGGIGQNYGKNTFSVELIARYHITPTMEARAGLNFTTNKYNTPISSEVQQNDNRAVNIPIGITVSF